MVNIVKPRLNPENNFKMCDVAVIMMRGSLLVLPTKYNYNILVEVYLFLLRVMHWKVSVYYYRQKQTYPHNHVHAMQCLFFLSDYSKQYTATTTTLSKSLIEMLKEKK